MKVVFFRVSTATLSGSNSAESLLLVSSGPVLRAQQLCSATRSAHSANNLNIFTIHQRGSRSSSRKASFQASRRPASASGLSYAFMQVSCFQEFQPLKRNVQ